MLREILNANKVRWYDMDNLDERDKEIARIMEQLDDCAVEYEKKWGIGVLQKNCSSEIRAKWDAQGDKFKTAVMDRNVDMIRELASGFKRAYEALERDCLGQGLKPKETDYMEHVIDDKHIIVCQTHDDVRIMLARAPNAVVWSMKEIAAVVSKHNLMHVLENKPKAPVTTDVDPFDFSVGDKVEF